MKRDYRGLYFQNEEYIQGFDFEGIDRIGIQEEGIDLTRLLTNIQKMDPQEFRNKIERKFDIIYHGDKELI